MADIKPIAGMKRHILGEELPLKTPYSVYIFPTNLCNFHCKYCAHSLGIETMKQRYHLQTGYMSLETLKKAADQLKEFPDKLKVISLTGHGEPLLHRQLPEMIAYIKDSDITEKIEFISNASLLNHKLSKQLIEAGLDCIRISIQGMNTEKYQEICRVKQDFSVLAEEIRYFYQQKKQCKVYIKIVDIALEDGEEDLFYQTFKDISDRMFIEQIKPVYAGVEATKDRKINSDRYGREHKKREVCPLCFYMMGILPNGDVSPCETIYVPEILGNVHQNTLYQMWNGEKNQKFRQMQLQKGHFFHRKCKDCCAPDDVSHPEDELDSFAEELLGQIERGKWK